MREKDRFYLCLTELDFRNLLSRLSSRYQTEWISGIPVDSEKDVEEWHRIGSSTVIWWSKDNTITLVNYFELKGTNTEVVTFDENLEEFR